MCKVVKCKFLLGCFHHTVTSFPAISIIIFICSQTRTCPLYRPEKVNSYTTNHCHCFLCIEETSDTGKNVYAAILPFGVLLIRFCLLHAQEFENTRGAFNFCCFSVETHILKILAHFMPHCWTSPPRRSLCCRAAGQHKPLEDI